MSLSKIYKHSDSFVAKQLLPSQGSSSESSWQEISGLRPRESFVADGPHGGNIVSSQNPDMPGLSSKTEGAVAATPPPEPLVPAVDLDMLRQRAFSEGVIEGRRQADKDFGNAALTLQSACNQLTNLHETILRNNLDEMHRLVMLIAEKIIRHSINEQSNTILATIEDAIRLAVKSEEFQIRINPQDLEAIQAKKKELIDDISGLDNIVLKTDNSIERGGCILESANCTVDATVDSQLQVIREALESSQEAGPLTATVVDEPFQKVL
jgi:flagellar assembly protein FliH